MVARWPSFGNGERAEMIGLPPSLLWRGGGEQTLFQYRE